MLKSAGYLVRRGSAWLKRRLVPRLPPRRIPDVLPYPQWIHQRLVDRLEDYPHVDDRGLFSLLTPVFDPPAGFLRVLGRSILAQDHPDWQWVVVDNGCQHPDVLYLLETFARDPRVTLVRASGPRGIVGGMRLALEHARNRYVCPVDHDDRLYPDALRVAAACLRHRDWPVIAYSDEDKLFPDGQPGLPLFKPDWDPLLFLNAFYIAHLGMMDRQVALQLGVYTDPQAEGTPDGDAFCRFVAAGYEPVHVPEVLYSWRMHMQSTAMRGIEAKPYATANQKHVLTRYLQNRGLAPQVQIRTNPLPKLPGSWRVDAESDPVKVLVTGGGTKTQRRLLHRRLKLARDLHEIRWLPSLRTAWQDGLAELREDEWIILVSPECLPVTTDFISEFKSVRAAVPEAVLVGGRLIDDTGKIVSAGLVWGFDGVIGSPLKGRAETDYETGQGVLCFQRSVTSVDPRFCLINVGFCREVLERSDCDLNDPLLPAWLGAIAREQSRRVLFTPYVTGQIHAGIPPRREESGAVHRFLKEFGERITIDPWYSRFYGLTPETAYQHAHPNLRITALRQALCPLADSCQDYLKWAGTLEKYRSFLIEPVEQKPDVLAQAG